MNLKLITVLTGVITIASSATPLAINAETAIPTPLLLAQATMQAQQGQFTNLNLSQEQIQQIWQIHAETGQKIEALLTPKQREQYTAALQNRRNQIRNGNETINSISPSQGRQQNILAILNLSKEQKSKIRQIVQSSRTRMNTILTNEQRKQLEQYRNFQLRNRVQ